MATTMATENKSFGTLWRAVPTAAKAGVILTVLSFLTPITVERERFVSGEAVCEFFDFGAWIFGLITVVLGIVTLVKPASPTTGSWSSPAACW